VVVTKHAEKRMRERMGINKRSVQKVAQKALEQGLSHSETKGQLRRYLDKQAIVFGWKCKWRISDNNIFAFTFDDILMTVLPLRYNLKN
jgi:hypothetical protein